MCYITPNKHPKHCCWTVALTQRLKAWLSTELETFQLCPGLAYELHAPVNAQGNLEELPLPDAFRASHLHPRTHVATQWLPVVHDQPISLLKLCGCNPRT